MLNICQAMKGFTKLVLQISCGATLNIKSHVHAYIIHFYCARLLANFSGLDYKVRTSHNLSSLTPEIVLGRSIYLSTDLSIYLSTHVSVYLYIYPSIYLSTHLSPYLSIYLFAYLPIYLYLSIRLSMYLPTYVSIYKYRVSGHYPSSCFYLEHNVSEMDSVPAFRKNLLSSRPSPCIYIPQEQGDLVITQGTGFTSRNLLRDSQGYGGGIRTRFHAREQFSEPQSELLYDWWFTAN
jgi:hypothetical protein